MERGRSKSDKKWKSGKSGNARNSCDVKMKIGRSKSRGRSKIGGSGKNAMRISRKRTSGMG